MGNLCQPSTVEEDEKGDADNTPEKENNAPPRIGSTSPSFGGEDVPADLLLAEEEEVVMDGGAKGEDRVTQLEVENAELASELEKYKAEVQKLRKRHLQTHVESSKKIRSLKRDHTVLHAKHETLNKEHAQLEEEHAEKVQELEQKTIELSLEIDELKGVKTELTEQAKEYCRQAFDSLDTNGDHMLQFEEYLQLIVDCQVDISVEQAKQYFDAMDKHQTGNVEYSTFENAFLNEIASYMMYETVCETSIYEAARKNAKQALYELDPHTLAIITKKSGKFAGVSHGGWIQLCDIKPARLQALTGFEKQACREAFEAIDTDGDGAIQFREFQKLLENLRIFKSHEDAESFFNMMDPDNSGEITFAEFETTFVHRLVDVMLYETVIDTDVFETKRCRHSPMYDVEKGTKIIVTKNESKVARLSTGGWVKRADIRQVWTPKKASETSSDAWGDDHIR